VWFFPRLIDLAVIFLWLCLRQDCSSVCMSDLLVGVSFVLNRLVLFNFVCHSYIPCQVLIAINSMKKNIGSLVQESLLVRFLRVLCLFSLGCRVLLVLLVSLIWSILAFLSKKFIVGVAARF